MVSVVLVFNLNLQFPTCFTIGTLFFLAHIFRCNLQTSWRVSRENLECDHFIGSLYYVDGSLPLYIYRMGFLRTRQDTSRPACVAGSYTLRHFHKLEKMIEFLSQTYPYILATLWRKPFRNLGLKCIRCTARRSDKKA